MNNINQHQISSLQQIFTSDPEPDFLEQMLSSVPSSSWPDVDHAPPQLEEQSTAVLASKLMQHQISNGAANALMLQQQLLDGAFFPMSNNHNDVVGVDVDSFVNTLLQANDASLFNGFAAGSIGQTSSQPQNLGEPAMNQPPRQRVRARRGQATDPHSIAERLRRERIAERMKALQELVPNGNKTDKASMLDEIIDYVKFLQLQVKVLSMSRLGGAAAGAGAGAASNEGRSGNRTQSASSPNNNKNETVTEHQVAKLMEEDMGSAMQYLQGKGLCLMPISLATAISTSHSRKPPLMSNNPLLNSDGRSPTSPSISALTVQSALIPTLKDSTSPST